MTSLDSIEFISILMETGGGVAIGIRDIVILAALHDGTPKVHVGDKGAESSSDHHEAIGVRDCQREHGDGTKTERMSRSGEDLCRREAKRLCDDYELIDLRLIRFIHSIDIHVPRCEILIH